MFAKKRIYIFRLAFCLGLVVVFGRVLQIHFQYGSRLNRWARSQESEVELKGARGKDLRPAGQRFGVLSRNV